MRRQTRREMLGLQQGQSERAEHLRTLAQDPCDDPRVLIIRRNRMGDMICTLPPVDLT